MNYILATNNLSYMNQKEFYEKFTGLLPLVETHSSKPIVSSKLPSECQGLPVYKNWINEGKVPKVKNQGNCKSNFLLSAVSALESAVAIEYGTNITELSTQHCLECVKNMTGIFTGCSGGR